MHLSVSSSIYFILLSVLAGASTASFLTCLAWRGAHGESIWKGRSHCENCRHPLSIRDLIPIISCLTLRGRCRYCGEKIPRVTLISELFGAFTCAAFMLKFESAEERTMWLIFAVILLIISLTDYYRYEIPDAALIAALVNRLSFWLISPNPLAGFPAFLAGSLSVSLPLLFLVLIMDHLQGEETMGGGDIKLFFVLGLYLDWKQMLLTLLTACILGTAGGLIQKRKLKRRAFPFAPYITAAAVLTVLFGQPVIDWYAALLL